MRIEIAVFTAITKKNKTFFLRRQKTHSGTRCSVVNCYHFEMVSLRLAFLKEIASLLTGRQVCVKNWCIVSVF
jgi:hypothetical protein